MSERSAAGQGLGVVLDPVMESINPSLDYWDAAQPPTVNPYAWGALEVRGYKDVRRILTDSDAYSREMDPFDTLVCRAYWNLDEPLHGELKRPVASHFRPRAVESRLSPTIDREVERAIGKILLEEEDSFTYDPFGEIPLRVMAEYTGIDSEDPAVATWLETLNMFRQTPEQEQATLQTLTELLAKARHTLEAENRLANPRNPVEGLAAAQLQKQQAGEEPMGDSLAASQIAMLRAAGDYTTATTQGNIMQAFERDIWDELRSDPAAVPNAVEEGVRRYSAAARTYGRTKTEVAVGEGSDAQTLPPDTVVNGIIHAANYDPRQFNDPFAFDIRRTPNNHLGFGGGWRSCDGSYLARAIMRSTVSAVATRVPGVQWDGVPFQRAQGSFIGVIPKGALTFTYDREHALRIAAEDS